MSQSPLVGRAEILQKLIQVLAQGWNYHGSVVFIEGVAGIGKTMLLKMLQEQVTHFPELAKTTFTFGSCYESTSSQNAYQPFIDILEALTKPTKKRSAAILTLNILKETAPDWLQIVPVVGAALGAAVKAATIAGQWLLDAHDDTQANQSKSLVTQYVNTLIKIASRQNFFILVIEDAHWIDDASCQLLLRLASKIGEYPLVVLVTYRPDYLDTQHPLKKVQREMLAKNLAQILRLTGLTQEQIQSYILKRFETSLHPKLAAWLEHLCKGNPLFATHYLSLLEQDNIIRRVDGSYRLDGDIRISQGQWKVSGTLAGVSIPDSLEAVIEQRIERLLKEDYEMLQLGAVQGDTFMSLLLVELLAKQEREVLAQLRQIVERQRIISIYVGEEGLKKRSEFYLFEHHLMQQAFYNKLSPRERVLHHQSVAQFLERLFKEEQNPPRRLLLEVAYHYSQADELLLGAQYYFLAAQSSFFDGAFVETIELCKTVRELLKQVDEQDRLLVEVIHLLLVASEIRWRGKPELQGELPLATLVEEAEAAARRTGDLALLAENQYLKGLVALVSDSQGHSVQILKEAVKTAQQSGDQLREFVIMSELGHRVKGENLLEGLTVLYQAHDLYTRMLATQAVPQTKALDRHLHRLQGLIGVAEFDHAKYDEAERWLNESIAGLRRLGIRDNLPSMFNYLGQLDIATGLFEEAETVLKEAVNLLKDEDEANPYKGYNLALLGKLYIEWDRLDDAVAPLLNGWQETQATWNISLVPLVRNYYAELLMHPHTRARDLVLAKHLLDTTLEETQVTGFHRSAIAALSLHSQLALLQGQVETAVGYSTQAVDYLQRVGIMPALRVEEVLFNHYQSLHAAQREHEAISYLKQAHTIVEHKADSIQDSAHRRAFLERVPISRAILKAMASIPSQEEAF